MGMVTGSASQIYSYNTSTVLYEYCRFRLLCTMQTARDYQLRLAVSAAQVE